MKIESSDLNLPSQKIKVETPVQVGAKTLYRHILPLIFTSHPLADRIDITAGQTLLQGDFSGKNYNVLDSNSPVGANFEEGENKAVIVTLDKPYIIGEIRLKQKRFTDLAEVIAAINEGLFDNYYTYHLQGVQSVGAAQVQSSQYEGSVQVLHEAAHHDYAIGAQWTIDFTKVELFRVDGNKVIDSASDSLDNGAGSENFIADRFAIKARDQYGEYIHFDKDDLSKLTVKSKPLGPRLGITTDGADIHSSDFFWSFPGEFNNATIDQQDLTMKWKKSLQQHFSGLSGDATKGADYTANLVIESDKPCEFDLSDFVILYNLVKSKNVLQSATGEDKKKLTLNFDGTALQSKPFKLAVPSDGQITSLKLKIDNSFRGEYLAALTGNITPFDFNNNTHIRVDDTRWIAQIIQLEKAQPVNSVAVALAGIEDGTECSLEIHDGGDNGPSGHKLAEAKITLNTNLNTAWYAVHLKETLTLYTDTYWLLLKCNQGSMLWHAINRENISSMLVLNRKDGAKQLDKVTTIKNYTARFALFRNMSVGNDETDRWPVKFLRNETYVENNLHLFESDGEQEVTWVDLTTKSNSALVKVAGMGGVGVVDWAVESLQKGILTVYEPEVGFEV